MTRLRIVLAVVLAVGLGYAGWAVHRVGDGGTTQLTLSGISAALATGVWLTALPELLRLRFTRTSPKDVRLFGQTIAEYTCSKFCGYHRSVPGANMSRFHLMAAATAAVPLWVFSLCQDFPWYYLPSIFAGELLLLYAAGFTLGLIAMPFTRAGTFVCPKCHSPMMFAGRHFDPKGSARPIWSDIAIFIGFIALNVAVWVAVLRGDFA